MKKIYLKNESATKYPAKYTVLTNPDHKYTWRKRKEVTLK